MKYFIWSSILLLFFISCKENPLNLKRIEGKQISITTEITTDSSINNLIIPYKKSLEAEMNQVLAYAPTDMYKSREKTETNIGNFMADLCYTRGNAVFNKRTQKNVDFVLLNFGGIRAGIPKGNVTIGNAYEVMPFENSMVVAELTYKKIEEFFNYMAVSGAHPFSKQLELIYENKTLKSAKLNGKDFDENRTYFVLTSDYLQNGGDRMNFFKNPVSLENLNYKIRAAIIDELKAIDTIHSKEDGRLIRR